MSILKAGSGRVDADGVWHWYDRRVQIVRYSSYPATPWKNGGGITREAIRVPAGGAPFLWRLSVAEIDQPGPFSDFAGYSRMMALLQGAGVTLTFADGTRQVLEHAGDLVTFDGALAVNCELNGGPCVDLNLMVDRRLGEPHGHVRRLRGPLTLTVPPTMLMLAFAIDASLAVEDAAGARAVLERWDLALLPGTASGSKTFILAPQTGAQAAVFLATVADAAR